MKRDPRKTLFTTQRLNPGMLHEGEDECSGCIFQKERHAVCLIAAEEAKLRGLSDCDDNVIYIAVKTDPRQIDLLGNENEPRTENI